MKTKRFVFDTNSLVSALIASFSVSRRSLKKADETGILVFSNETLSELNEVLIRSSINMLRSKIVLNILSDWRREACL